jgi:hypothetical protein
MTARRGLRDVDNTQAVDGTCVRDVGGGRQLIEKKICKLLSS